MRNDRQYIHILWATEQYPTQCGHPGCIAARGEAPVIPC